tara:strand:+ start:456 stop:899 length:444 start_codon:yes stop_codon:yes gene_type:complete
MLYFAYGSNLNWRQMLVERCPGSKFITKYSLNGYKLIFSNYNPKSVFGHANIVKNKNSKVNGAIWNITSKNEKVLDIYEGVPTYYQKEYIKWNKKKVLVYIQNNFIKKKPSSSYLHTIIEGYKNCDLELSYLKKKISLYNLNFKINW